MNPSTAARTSREASLGPRLGEGRVAEVFAWDEGQILRLYRSEVSRAWVEKQVGLGRALQAAGLPVPAVGDAIEIGGRLGIVYERIEGPPLLGAMAQQPWSLRRAARRFAELHATMHETPGEGLPAQRSQLEHSLTRAPGLTPDLRAHVLRHLAGLPGGEALCHGDYHPNNILMAQRGPVIIDWETASRGNPIADVARTLLILRVGRLPVGIGLTPRILFELMRRLFRDRYLAEYRKRRPASQAQIDEWMPVLAAARLDERIPGEENVLLSLVAAVSDRCT